MPECFHRVCVRALVQLRKRITRKLNNDGSNLFWSGQDN